jgi:hypothetical protein
LPAVCAVALMVAARRDTARAIYGSRFVSLTPGLDLRRIAGLLWIDTTNAIGTRAGPLSMTAAARARYLVVTTVRYDLIEETC